MKVTLGSKCNVYIPIELKNREFISQVFLATELVRKGHCVYLGSHAAIFSLLDSKSTRDGIYLDKGTQILSRTKKISEKVEKMMILDQELSPSFSSQDFPGIENTVASRFYPETQSYVDHFFTIGEPYTSHAQTYLGPEFVTESGWPRMEFLTKQSKTFYAKEIESIRRKLGTFTLFPSNFFLSQSITSKARLNRYFQAGSQVPSIEGLKIEMEKAQSLSDLFNKWRNDGFTDRIVVRPHLVESIKVWKSLMRKVKNVSVIRKMEIYPWLHAAENIIHFGSTSAIQASLIGKPVFFINELASRTPSGLSVNLSLGKVGIENSPNNPIQSDLSATEVSLKHNLSSYGSIGVIANVIKELTSSSHYTNPHPCINLFRIGVSSSKIRRSAGLFKDEIKRFVGQIPHNTQLQNIPFGITALETKKIVNRISGDSCAKVKQVGINLVLMAPNGDSRSRA